MKTLLKIFFGIIALLVIVALLSPDETTEEALTDTEITDSDDSETKKDPAFKAEQLAKLESVKKSFNFKGDEFNGGGWYTHKLWGRNFLNRNGLVCKVNSQGYIYLESNYYGNDWIFHDRIQVKVGDNVLHSETVPSYSENNIHENSGGSVWEVVQYTDKKDNGIIAAIAYNTDKDVKVRFVGRNYNKDIILTLNDKKAIEECQRLADLLVLTR